MQPPMTLAAPSNRQPAPINIIKPPEPRLSLFAGVAKAPSLSADSSLLDSTLPLAAETVNGRRCVPAFNAAPSLPSTAGLASAGGFGAVFGGSTAASSPP